MKKLALVPALAAFLALPSASFADVTTYTLEKPHSQVLFFVNHLGFSNSEGEFLDFDGTLDIDDANPAQSKVDVTIKTASIEMDDQKWNDHLKNADFFNVEQYPEMTFKSTNVEVTGENTANVTGDLTLLGVTKPVTLNVTHNKTGAHPMNGKSGIGFSATGTLKRSDFGMNYGLPAVGDDVELRIEVEAYDETSAETAQ